MSLQKFESTRPVITRDRRTAALYDDIEYLIEIAGRLFSAIEQQIRFIEVSLTVAPDNHPRSPIVLKEQLIRIAASLNVSLEEFAVRLEERTDRPISLTRAHDSDELPIRHQGMTC
jgi:hypothetical protein